MQHIKAKEKKAQHYVPQCYLESWAIPNTHQVFVYNKKERKFHKSNIKNVASERYFYDIDFSKILTKEQLTELGITNEEITQLENGQFIENFFSKYIESDFKKRLSRFIEKANIITPWEINNCYFVSNKDKELFSFHLALQYIRVKTVRNSIADTADCFQQVLEDMEVPKEIIEKNIPSKSDFPYIHGKMIFDQESIREAAQLFFSYSWTFLINNTDTPFYTSDSPIFTKPHIKHPFLSMNGLASKGVEVVFPISPNLLLVMCDADYHKEMRLLDRKASITTLIKMVEHYNVCQAFWCERFTISNENNFKEIKEHISKNPDYFNVDHTTTLWGGKVYKPRKKEKK